MVERLHSYLILICDKYTFIREKCGKRQPNSTIKNIEHVRPPPMQRCLDEVLSILNALATQVPNAKVLIFWVLIFMHLISCRLRIVLSPRYTRLAPFLPGVTKLVSHFLLINLPHQTLCLCGRLSTCMSKYNSGL